MTDADRKEVEVIARETTSWGVRIVVIILGTVVAFRIEGALLRISALEAQVKELKQTKPWDSTVSAK